MENIPNIQDLISNSLTNAGYKPHQVAAVIGNLQRESSLNPIAIGDNGQSFGLAQWNKDRLEGLKQYAADNNSDINDPKTQVNYLVKELDTTEKNAGNQLRNSKDINDASMALINYERPANKVDAFNKNVKFSDDVIPFEPLNSKSSNSNEDDIPFESIKETLPNSVKTNKTSVGDYATGLVSQAGQGLTLGFGNRLAAGEQAVIDKLMGSPLSLDDAYEMHKQSNKSYNENFAKENPLASFAANVVGSAPTSIGPNSVAKLLALGALQGASNSDDLTDIPNTLTKAGVGGITTAVAGKSLEGLGNLVGNGIKGLATQGSEGGITGKITGGLNNAVSNLADLYANPAQKVDLIKNAINESKLPQGLVDNFVKDTGEKYNNSIVSNVLNKIIAPNGENTLKSAADKIAGNVIGASSLSDAGKVFAQGINKSPTTALLGLHQAYTGAGLTSAGIQTLSKTLGLSAAGLNTLLSSKFAEPIISAANRGPIALSITNKLLSDSNPEYKDFFNNSNEDDIPFEPIK